MADGLPLTSGAKLPAMGLGVWKVPAERCAALIDEAISIGYRHFDCACDYGNEAEVGEGLQRAIQAHPIARDDLWVTSKLWNTYHRRQHVRAAAERSLSDLRLDYLDLYLIHFPIAQQFVDFQDRYPPGWFFDPQADMPQMRFDQVPLSETWEAMEDLVKAGLVREIGVCNFGTALLRDLSSHARIQPAVLQIELHPYLTQEKLLRFCEQQGVRVTAFSPLGAGSYCELEMATPEESVLREPVVQAIAGNHQRTAAQIVLRWAIQRGTAVVPKTVSTERLLENWQAQDFVLTDREMQQINQLDRGRRFNDPGDFCERAFNTFCPIYE